MYTTLKNYILFLLFPLYPFYYIIYTTFIRSTVNTSYYNSLETRKDTVNEIWLHHPSICFSSSTPKEETTDTFKIEPSDREAARRFSSVEMSKLRETPEQEAPEDKHKTRYVWFSVLMGRSLQLILLKLSNSHQNKSRWINKKQQEEKNTYF